MLENLILNGKSTYKLILKRSNNKKVGEIPSKFLESLTINAVDHNQLTLKIPKYINVVDASKNEDAVQKIENKHFNLKEKWIIDVYINDGKNKVENKLSF